MRGKLTRENSALTRPETLEILKNAEYGVLATVNAKGEPSAIALNHLLVGEETLVFHGARRGEKISNLNANPNVSFFVVGSARLKPENLETVYTSAVAHGKAKIIEGESARPYLKAFVERFVGDALPPEERLRAIEDGLSAVAIIKMTITHLTGKTRPGR